MERLETTRVVLREWIIDDAEDVYEYAQNKKVGPMAGWKPHDNLEETKKIIKMFIEEKETWAICLKDTNKVIGSIGLHHTKSETERMLGYVLAEPYWGKGLTLEAANCLIEYAFNHLGVEQISTYHFPFNIQSKRVIEKLGFNYNGVREKAAKIFDGQVYDEVAYIMSKEDYM